MGYHFSKQICLCIGALFCCSVSNEALYADTLSAEEVKPEFATEKFNSLT